MNHPLSPSDNFFWGKADRLQNCSEGDDARMTCKTVANGQIKARSA